MHVCSAIKASLHVKADPPSIVNSAPMIIYTSKIFWFQTFSHYIRCTFIEQQELSKQDRTPIRAELRAFLQALTIGHQQEGDFVVHVDSEHVWQFWHRHRISFQLDGYTTLENADLLKKIGDKAQCILETANVCLFVCFSGKNPVDGVLPPRREPKVAPTRTTHAQT